jgi:nucleotide-binding universal stress UspA family protein
MTGTDQDEPRHNPHTDEVVVAVDGSEGSRKALRWASAVADGIGAPLRVMQSWQYPSSLPLPWSRTSPPVPEEVDDEVRAELWALLADELPEQSDVAVEVLRGPPTGALLDRITPAPPRLLVVGSRGLGGFSGLLLGSVSRACLEYLPCPVVVVPSDDQATVPEHLGDIVVGVDGSSASRSALEFALALARDARSSVTAVHAFEPTFAEIPPDVSGELRLEAETRLRHTWCAPLATEDVPAECLVVDGDARQTLPDVAAERGAHLIVIGAIGTGTVQKLLGPVASHLASHAPMPVAVVRQMSDIP